jgi:hypothetical protein
MTTLVSKRKEYLEVRNGEFLGFSHIAIVGGC